MSKRVINPDQLQFIATGRDLQEQITHSADRMPLQTMNDLWEHKLKESKYQNEGEKSLYQSMEERGFDPTLARGHNQTVRLHFGKTKRLVSDMHHRIAVAADLEKSGKRTIYFPVENHQLF